ncbi:MAG: hypothetical protein HY795_17180 [Desulfovibrio sp.]|jgi:hypothetical protein|nr:hypothetical protein [Desulfovibrio sp.]
MSPCRTKGKGCCSDDSISEQFQYVRRGPNGEYIIPEEKIEDFVRRYMELADNNDHLERLRAYLNTGMRNKPGELDD